MSLFKKMADKHEKELVDLLGGSLSRGSGNQWKSQMDGRHNRMTRRFAFAWDGKSTLRQGLSVTLKMWKKAKEQAAGERPMLAFRFYGTESLDVVEDLVVLDLHDFSELLEAAESVREEPTRIIIFEGAYGPSSKSISPLLDLRFVMIKDGQVTFPKQVVLNRPINFESDYAWAGAHVIRPLRDDPIEVMIDGVPLKGRIEIYRHQKKILDQEFE